MGFKKLLKPRVIVWFATTVVLVATFSVANFFATKMYGSLLDRVFGGKRAITEERDKSAPGYLTKTEAYDNGNAVTQEICEEGMILLKNEGNALPLKANAKISVFGKNSTNFERTVDGKKKTIGLVYGGSGSAAPQDGERKTIYDSLTAAGFSYNEALKSFYETHGEGRSDNPSMADAIGGIPALKTGEVSPNDFTTDVTNSISQYKDAALIVLSRIAGEEWDLPRVAADDADRHYLELDNNERALVQYVVNQGFEHVVLLMNGSNYIDLGFLKASTGGEDYTNFGSKIDAAINIGSPGGFGIMALGKILSGAVNPSGHTVDLVYTQYDQDPTWQNFGGNLGISDAYKGTPYSYVEYEENIYFGYRYYETRDFVNNDGHAWYDEHVVYPFGFGLSYTTFSEEIVDVAELEADPLKANETFDVYVKVKNTGEKAGKDVVQLYVTTPYKDNGIEKVYKSLVGFAKTDLLEPNAEGVVKITVDPYNFASFDSKDKNGNHFKGWELDDGDYVFHVAKDSHTDVATFTKNLASPARFENDPLTGTKVEPLYPEVTEHMKVEESLSRTNFAGTMPKMTTEAERVAPSELIDAIRSVEVTNPEKAESMPKTNAGVSITLKELVGAEYDDGLWEQFLDQMTFEEMLKLFNEGCYSTIDIERLGVPRTISSDGPTGLVCFLSNMVDIGGISQPEVYGTCYYQSECLLAQTYNLDLAEKQAHAIGDEGYVGNERGDGLTYPGWYAPAVNLHRSPFSGRNTEYYSEDPFISGKFAAKVIKGVQEKGMYANVKHFALNDQETHRNGICTWCDEQAIRELYLRPFEMAVKEGKTLGLMSSFNRIGTEWTGGSYRLLTKILRNEWGFKGSVICDYHTTDYMDSKQMLYAGGDLNLCSTDAQMLQTTDIYDTPYVSKSDATDVMMLRRSAHNNLYAIVNSSAMDVNILGYRMATWRVILIVVDCVVGASLATWGFFAIFTALRKKPKEVPAAE